MKYIKLFEDFQDYNDYYTLLYQPIKNVIVKLKYDTNKPMELIAELLSNEGISKPLSAQIANKMSSWNKFDPTKVDHYIENIINSLEYNNDNPIIKNLWGIEGT